MKRITVITGMLFLAAFGLAAAVWDGSAVAGGAGDFPDDGLYGACNSFPRDTAVTVTNLENGKTVSVVITQNVDNPGVFIALSPKAAAALGMRAGSAARIRAVALIASQADTSLPPTRAGETADPDYNPKVYVDREKAAVAAAAAAPSPAAAPTVAPAPTLAPALPLTPAAPAVAQTVSPPAATAPAAVANIAKPESAEVLAKVAEPKKEPTPSPPSLNEPKPVGAAPAIAVAPVPTAPVPAPKAPPAAVAAAPAPAAPKAAAVKVPADNLPLPEASPTFPGSPRPSPLGMSLPTPDAPPVPPSSAPTARGGYLAQAPEILGDPKPKPRKMPAPRLVIADPALPSAGTTPATAAKTTEAASVDGLSRPPQAKAPPSKLALAEPSPQFAPDQLPDAVLSRIIAPTKVVPNPVLAEAQTPVNEADIKKGPEAIAFEKPSYADEVEAAALAEASTTSPSAAYALSRPGRAVGEQSVAGLAEAELPGQPEALYSSRPLKTAGTDTSIGLSEAAPPGSPDAIADRKAAGEGGGLSELQVPDVPRPSEGIAAEKPRNGLSGAVAAELAEPNIASPSATGSGPTVIADSRKGPGSNAVAELSDPSVPTPTESLTAGSPSAVAPGEAVAELSEPDPTRPASAAVPDTATAVVAEKPAPPAPPGAIDLASPLVPNPDLSIAAHPATVPAGKQVITLEPATPRPPTSIVPGPAVTEPKPLQPAAVATIKAQPPVGAAQAPTAVPMLKGLAKGSFYVQIGVYGTNDALQTAIAGFKSSSYPLAVEKLTTKAGSGAYRLFVGPLSRDESGVVLIRIRSLGFKDAYVRQGT